MSGTICHLCLGSLIEIRGFFVAKFAHFGGMRRSGAVLVPFSGATRNLDSSCHLVCHSSIDLIFTRGNRGLPAGELNPVKKRRFHFGFARRQWTRHRPYIDTARLIALRSSISFASPIRQRSPPGQSHNFSGNTKSTPSRPQKVPAYTFFDWSEARRNVRRLSSADVDGRGRMPR